MATQLHRILGIGILVAAGAASWTGAMAAQGPQGKIVSIAADGLTAAYNPADGTLTIRRGDRQFISGGTFDDFLPPGQRTVKKTTSQSATDAAPVPALRIEHPSGRGVLVSLHAARPSARIRGWVRNPGPDPMTLDQILLFRARIELGTPAQAAAPLAELRTLGYDGLALAALPRTRYMFLAVADPQTRAGVICAWLTDAGASGLVRSQGDPGQVRVEAVSQYGRVVIPPGGERQGAELVLDYFDNAAEGLEAYADAVARAYRIRLKPVPCGYMTWYHARALDEKRMPVLARWCEANLKKYGWDFLQIDDGWQAANRDFTGHDPKGVYPSGMKPTAEAIARHGFRPGIWITPFGWDHKRPAFAAHQDWFVQRKDGSVYAVEWGGDSLDMSHPQAREFLKGVLGRIGKDWGYTFFKLDGLWAGLAAKILYPDPKFRPDDFGDAVFHDPRMSNVDAYRTGLKLVREAVGPDAYLLGCTVSQNMRTLQASIGLVDGMRVGIDSGRTWDGIVQNVKVATSVHFLHGRVWHNDPDVLYLDKSFTTDQVRTFASWLAISGQMYMVSEWLPEVPADRLEIVKRTIPNHQRLARPVDLFENFPARVWHLSSGQRPWRRDVVAVFNWGDKPQKVTVDPNRLGLPDGQYARFDFWADRLLPDQPGPWHLDLPARACQVIALVQHVDHPRVVSTSRHVTQGILDLAGETWDAKTQTLRGISRVVGGEPYELRMAEPPKAETWVEAQTGVSPDDAQAGVTIRAEKPRAGTRRIVLQSPVSREVSWQVRFRHGVLVDPIPKAVR